MTEKINDAIEDVYVVRDDQLYKAEVRVDAAALVNDWVEKLCHEHPAEGVDLLVALYKMGGLNVDAMPPWATRQLDELATAPPAAAPTAAPTALPPINVQIAPPEIVIREAPLTVNVSPEIKQRGVRVERDADGRVVRTIPDDGKKRKK